MTQSENNDNLLIDDPNQTVRILTIEEFRKLAAECGWKPNAIEFFCHPPHLEFILNQERVIIHDEPRFVTPLRKGIAAQQ